VKERDTKGKRLSGEERLNAGFQDAYTKIGKKKKGQIYKEHWREKERARGQEGERTSDQATLGAAVRSSRTVPLRLVVENGVLPVKVIERK